jgi:hypothetical protein
MNLYRIFAEKNIIKTLFLSWNCPLPRPFVEHVRNAESVARYVAVFTSSPKPVSPTFELFRIAMAV